MISRCLQTCPVDCGAALELTELICDIEPERRDETEFWLVYRKDTPLNIPKRFSELARQKFGRSGAFAARNFDDGWPAGSNMLAHSAFLEMELLRRAGTCKNEAFLLFEPDCVPMAADWLDQLSAEWLKARENGKTAFGHWHQQWDESTRHMNGNAVFAITHFEKYGHLLIGPATMGWDYFYREHFIGISQDSNLIHQLYSTWGLSEEAFDALQKNGVRPAFLHGVKDDSARKISRKRLVNACKSVSNYNCATLESETPL